jgi:acyl-CoA thioesterase FadM
VALVLDEALSKVSRLYDLRAVTAALNVEYLRPVRVGEMLQVEAHQERRDGRQLYHAGEIRDAAGRVLARAQGRFVVVDPERFRAASGNRETLNSKENER